MDQPEMIMLREDGATVRVQGLQMTRYLTQLGLTDSVDALCAWGPVCSNTSAGCKTPATAPLFKVTGSVPGLKTLMGTVVECCVCTTV